MIQNWFTGSILATTQIRPLPWPWKPSTKITSWRPSKNAHYLHAGYKCDSMTSHMRGHHQLWGSRVINKELVRAAHMDFITFPGVWVGCIRSLADGSVRLMQFRQRQTGRDRLGCWASSHPRYIMQIDIIW